tara:strand:- start:4693 stop:4917 length:225 start_codon:yes stop_codon:yes gene_type:complete
VLLNEIVQKQERDAGMQVVVVLEVAPCDEIVETITPVIEAIEAEKRVMVAKEAVLIGDLDEQEDSIPMPLSPAR